LVADYGHATKVFAEAVSELERRIGTSSKADHEKLHQLVDEAWLKSEQARLALEKHIVDHDC
jgi:hypothetical protein